MDALIPIKRENVVDSTMAHGKTVKVCNLCSDLPKTYFLQSGQYYTGR